MSPTRHRQEDLPSAPGYFESRMRCLDIVVLCGNSEKYACPRIFSTDHEVGKRSFDWREQAEPMQRLPCCQSRRICTVEDVPFNASGRARTLWDRTDSGDDDSDALR